MNKQKSFLTITDFSRDELSGCLELALQLKKERADSTWKPLTGQTWALIFHKASTRTRVSFEVGINELGGRAMILDQKRMQTGRGETIGDTAQVLSRYLHGLIIRTYEQSIVETFASEGSVPVVNALTDILHPCQVCSDLFTLAERWGRKGALMESLRGRKIAFLGDCASNMANSWILGGAVSGMEVVLSGPADYAPEHIVDELLEKNGLSKTYIFKEDPVEAARDADVVYTDVWVSMGDEDEQEKRIMAMTPFQVSDEVMSVAADDAFFMHCLPAHVGEEVSEEVYRSPQSIVLDQAENRLHMQKAILSFLVKGDINH